MNFVRTSGLNFNIHNTEKPKEMIERAKELRAKFDTWNISFDEEEFVNDIVIPSLSPAYAEITEQHRRYADYPVPDPADASATAVYQHLVRPVATLDELITRLQQVISRTDPFDYVHYAVKEATRESKKMMMMMMMMMMKKKKKGRKKNSRMKSGHGRGRGRGRSGRGQGREIAKNDRVRAISHGQKNQN